MAKIHQLSELLISQIKAGEVIERPSSALKELLDNAIDSGADTIKASIEKGGLSLISVEDNGEGIAQDDLVLAFARHATSKIKTFEDLSHAKTMGFRGEALASLAAISKCKITSATAEGSCYSIEAEEGKTSEVISSARQKGTTTSARDLFFYVPARRKFLKSEPTEAGHCRDVFVRAALSRPDIAMSFFKDGKPVYRLPAQTARERAIALIGSSFSGELASVSAAFGDYSIEGFCAPMGSLPSGKETQLLFVNKRYARDKLLNHAAKEALIKSRGLGREKEVAFVLHFELPTESVDSNAHPAKTEVRFKDPRAAHQFVYKALCDALATLPPPEPLVNDPSFAHRPLGADLREKEQDSDLFGEGSAPSGSNGGYTPSYPTSYQKSYPNSSQQNSYISSRDSGSSGSSWSSKREISSEAESYLGLLRSGYCGWDSAEGIWLVHPSSLLKAELAMKMADLAESGELSACEQLIAAKFEGLEDIGGILKSRKAQLISLGIEINWLSAGEGEITFAPDSFDNCKWSESLRYVSTCLLSGKTDALSLCLALCRGLPEQVADEEKLASIAAVWMEKRRHSRELPQAKFMAYEKT